MNANRYEEVRSIQVNHLVSLWFGEDKECVEGLGERIDEKVDSYANGELDHAMEAMTLLWELLRGGESSPPIPEAPTSSPVCPLPF